jgi:predicted HicB family RNase H-like nuclease
VPDTTEKLSEELKLRLPPRLFLDLSRLAAAQDRSLSDYVRHRLSLDVYGEMSRLPEGGGNE